MALRCMIQGVSCLCHTNLCQVMNCVSYSWLMSTVNQHHWCLMQLYSVIHNNLLSLSLGKASTARPIGPAAVVLFCAGVCAPGLAARASARRGWGCPTPTQPLPSGLTAGHGSAPRRGWSCLCKNRLTDEALPCRVRSTAWETALRAPRWGGEEVLQVPFLSKLRSVNKEGVKWKIFCWCSHKIE